MGAEDEVEIPGDFSFNLTGQGEGEDKVIPPAPKPKWNDDGTPDFSHLN